MAVKRGLGRGLDVLLGGVSGGQNAEDRLQTLALHLLDPGKYQPRHQMDDDALRELADSIRSQGVIQPIVVRAKADGRYEIVAGERRFRAAKLAGLYDVPVVVRELSDEATLAVALIENLQREDLNAIEEAQGMARLIEEFDLTQERVGQILGRARASVSNALRLLTLPDAVQNLLHSGQLSMGHGRALLSLPVLSQLELAQRAVAESWSVRELEKQAQLLLNQEDISSVASQKNAQDPDILTLEEELCDCLGMNVQIKHKKSGAGSLKIEYQSLAQFEDFLAILRAHFQK